MKNNNTPKNESTLPELLSQVLNHPDLPEEMGNKLEHAVSEIFNEHVDQSEIMAYERSVPYLEMILRGYHAKRAENEGGNVVEFRTEAI